MFPPFRSVCACFGWRGTLLGVDVRYSINAAVDAGIPSITKEWGIE